MKINAKAWSWVASAVWQEGQRRWVGQGGLVESA